MMLTVTLTIPLLKGIPLMAKGKNYHKIPLILLVKSVFCTVGIIYNEHHHVLSYKGFTVEWRVCVVVIRQNCVGITSNKFFVSVAIEHNLNYHHQTHPTH